MRRGSKPLAGSDGQGVGANHQRLGVHVYDFKRKQTPAIKAGKQIESIPEQAISQHDKGKELTWGASNTLAPKRPRSFTNDLTRMWMCGMNDSAKPNPLPFWLKSLRPFELKGGAFCLRSHHKLLKGAQADWHRQEFVGSLKSLIKGSVSVNSGVLSGEHPGAGQMAKEPGWQGWPRACPWRTHGERRGWQLMLTLLLGWLLEAGLV